MSLTDPPPTTGTGSAAAGTGSVAAGTGSVAAGAGACPLASDSLKIPGQAPPPPAAPAATEPVPDVGMTPAHPAGYPVHLAPQHPPRPAAPPPPRPCTDPPSHCSPPHCWHHHCWPRRPRMAGTATSKRPAARPANRNVRCSSCFVARPDPSAGPGMSRLLMKTSRSPRSVGGLSACGSPGSRASTSTGSPSTWT